jgi:hypothetical protein
VRDDQKKKSGDVGTPSEPLMEESGDGVVTAEMLNGVIRNALGEDSDTSFEVIGTRVHVSRGTEAKVQAIREAFADLAKTLSRNVTVEFKIGRIEGGGPIPREPDELLSKLGTSVSVPTSLSDQFLIAGGLEQSAIIDQDVEIAQQAQIADPIVAPLFNGYVISGVASASGSDRIELVLDLQYQELLPWPNPAFASRAENVGPVDLPQVDSTMGRYKLLLESGRWTVVTASNPGESSALVILARARW